MRRVGLLGLIAGAFLTASVASATATPPEFGRCVKVAVGTGVYATGNCTREGGEKKFEWFPGPGPKVGFTTEGGPLTLEGATSRAKILCERESGTGEITGPQTVGNLTLVLTGCEPAGGECKSKGAKAHEIALSGLTGTLGVVKAGETPLKDKLGLTIEGEWAFECGGGLVNVVERGSMIGLISPTNSKATKRAWKFAQRNGFQKPEMFEGGLPQFYEDTVNGTPEREGIELSMTLLSEEKVEINTVV